MAATPQSVGVARRSAAQFAESVGADDSVLGKVRLAVTEAVTNVVRHAYGPESGPVELLAELDGASLVVTVRDSGSGMGRARSRGGLGIGLRLIGEVTSACEVATSPGVGTTLRMTFPVDPDSDGRELAQAV
jgi:serine/threonine-protein kinase RsbW